MRHLHLGALVLALLVGLNLTIICQGHNASSRHFGPHVTFLFGVGHTMAPETALPGQQSSTHASLHPAMVGMPGMDEIPYYPPDTLPASDVEVTPIFDTPGLSPAELLSLRSMAGLPVSSAGASIPAIASGAQSIGEGISTLGLAFVAITAPATDPVRRPEPLAFTLRGSQTILDPESPPPRTTPS